MLLNYTVKAAYCIRRCQDLTAVPTRVKKTHLLGPKLRAESRSTKYEDRLKIDRLEDHTSLCLVKNKNFMCHKNVSMQLINSTIQ